MPAKKGPSKRSKAISSYEQALKFLHKEDYTKALTAFQTIIETYEDETDLVSRSHTFQKLCERALRRKAKPAALDAQGLYDQGIVDHNNGSWDEAAEAFQSSLKKIKKVSDQDHVYRALAATYARKGDTEQAILFLKKAIDTDEVHRFQAQNDPDFGNISSDETFRQLVWPEP